MNRKSRLTVILALLILMSLLGACVSQPAAENGKKDSDKAAADLKTFKYANNYPDLLSLDVHKHTTTEVMQAALPVCETLLRLDAEGNIVPVLLEELPVLEDDKKTYRFKLKEGILFHDGTELKAQDVYFTYHRIFDPATQNVNTWLCDMIKGGKAMLEGQEKELSGVKVLDDYQFTIELQEPNATFLAILCTPQMAIYPEKACREAGDQWGTDAEHYIGTGPFKVTEFIAKDHVSYVKNSQYHGKAPLLDEFTIYNKDPNTSLMEYEAGTLDMVGVDFTMVEPYKTEAYQKNLVKIPVAGVVALNLNVKMAPLDNVKVREAVSYAIDQETLAGKTLQGNVNPTRCLIPAGIMAHDAKRPVSKYDPEKAKALLAEAGFPDGISLEATVSEKSTVLNTAVALQEQFKASNIDFSIAKVDDASYIAMRKAGEVQTPFLTWYADFNDPDNFLYTFYYSTSSKAFSSNWNDAKTDELMEKGRQLPQDQRAPLYTELENYLVNEQFITVPLYNPVFYYLMKDGLQGSFFENQFIRFENIQN